MSHVWVPANKLIRWEHCMHCGVIRRVDDKNAPCKGPAWVRLR